MASWQRHKDDEKTLESYVSQPNEPPVLCFLRRNSLSPSFPVSCFVVVYFNLIVVLTLEVFANSLLLFIFFSHSPVPHWVQNSRQAKYVPWNNQTSTGFLVVVNEADYAIDRMRRRKCFMVTFFVSLWPAWGEVPNGFWFRRMRLTRNVTMST